MRCWQPRLPAGSVSSSRGALLGGQLVVSYSAVHLAQRRSHCRPVAVLSGHDQRVLPGSPSAAQQPKQQQQHQPGLWQQPGVAVPAALQIATEQSGIGTLPHGVGNGAAGPFTAQGNAEQLLQQVTEQQVVLLQQQVALLTQLLQQSQQTNAALASHVQLLSQELSDIRMQLQQTAQPLKVTQQPSEHQLQQLQGAQQQDSDPATAQGAIYTEQVTRNGYTPDAGHSAQPTLAASVAADWLQQRHQPPGDGIVIKREQQQQQQQGTSDNADGTNQVEQGVLAAGAAHQYARDANALSCADMGGAAMALPAAVAEGAVTAVLTATAATVRASQDVTRSLGSANDGATLHQAAVAAYAEAEAVVTAMSSAPRSASATTVLEVQQADQTAAEAALADAGAGTEASVAAPTAGTAAETTEQEAVTSEDAADGLSGKPQSLRPCGDAYVTAVRSCRRVQQLQVEYEKAAASAAHQLEPWQLVATLQHLGGMYYGGSSSLANTATDGDSQHKSRTARSAADLASKVLLQLCSHPWLWVAPEGTQLGSALYPYEVKALLVAAANLRLRVPDTTSPALQALVATALNRQHPVASNGARTVAHQDTNFSLQEEQAVQLMCSAVLLGLEVGAESQHVFSNLQAEQIAAFGVFTHALLVAAAAASLEHAHGSAASNRNGVAAEVQGPYSAVPHALLIAALGLLGATHGQKLNRLLGAQRIQQLLVLPMAKLTQCGWQLQHSEDMQHRQDVCDTQQCAQHVCLSVQVAVIDGLMAQRQKAQQQQRQQQPAGTANTAGNTVRNHACWSLSQAATVLLLTTGQLQCQLTTSCLKVFVAAAQEGMASIPLHLMVPVIHMVRQAAAAVAAEAGSAEALAAIPENSLPSTESSMAAAQECQGMEEASTAQLQQAAAQCQPRSQLRMFLLSKWRSAVLKHLELHIGLMPVDQVLSGIIGLAQHHTEEAQRIADGSTDARASFESFPAHCECVLAAAVKHQLQATSNRTGGVCRTGNTSSASRISNNTNSTHRQQPQQLQYNAQHLVLLLPQLAPAGLQPRSETATALVELCLQTAAAQQQQQQGNGAQSAGHKGPNMALTLAAALAAVQEWQNHPEASALQQLSQLAQKHSEPGQGPAATGSAAVAALQAIAAAAAANAAKGQPPLPAGQLDEMCYVLSTNLAELSAGQLVDTISALVSIGVPLQGALGVRMLDAKSKVTYGAVIAAAASAATSADKLPSLPAGAAARLLVAVAQLGIAPEPQWLGAVTQRLEGQLAQLSSDGLHQLLVAFVRLQGVAPISVSLLDEATQVVLISYQRLNTAGTLLEQKQASTESAAYFIACATSLARLSAQTTPAFGQALLEAVDQHLLQSTNAGIAQTQQAAVAAAALLADGLTAVVGMGVQPDAGWLSRCAATVDRLLPHSNGDCCCQVVVALARLQCAGSASLLHKAQAQVDSQLSAMSAGGLAQVIKAIVDLGSRPSPVMANALVIKTQQRLQQVVAASSSGNIISSSESDGVTAAMLPGGVPAADFAGAAWALAVAGVKPATSWCSAAVQCLAAVAATLPALQLCQVLFAAASWGITPLPKPIVSAVQSLQPQQLAELGQQPEQLQLMATSLSLADATLPHSLLAHLPAEAPEQKAAETLADRSRAAELAETLWQHVNSIGSAQPGSSSGSSSDSNATAGLSMLLLQQVAAGLQGHSASALSSYLNPPAHWAQILQAIWRQQQQWQQQPANEACNLLYIPGMQQLLQQVATAVQAEAATARSLADGPNTLTAIVGLQLPVNSDWLASLQYDMKIHSGGKRSWFKSASAQDIGAYMWAVMTLGQQQLSDQQLEAALQHLPGKVQHLPAGQAVQLMEVAASAVTGASQQQQQQRHRRLAVNLVNAYLTQLHEAAKSGAIGQAAARQLILALVQLEAPVLKQPNQQSSSASGAEQVVPGAASSKAINKASKRAANQQQHNQQLGATGEAWGCCFTAEAQLQLLQIALGTSGSSTEAQHSSSAVAASSGADSRAAAAVADASFLVGCSQLLATVPEALRPAGLTQQLLFSIQNKLLQQEDPLDPAVAAQLFCSLANLVMTPAIRCGEALPDSAIGGCLVQLLGDAGEDWSLVGAAELAAIPRQVSALHLSMPEPQAFIIAVLQQQQAFIALAKSSPVDMWQAIVAGAGPVQLLTAAAHLVMDEHPAEAGNSSWSGLVEMVVSMDDITAAARTEIPVMLPMELFAATSAAVDPVATSLSISDLADLFHCFTVAAGWQAGAQWVAVASAKLPRVKEISKLSPHQQLGLLVSYQQLLAQLPPQQLFSSELVKAVIALLEASRPILHVWPPKMLTFAVSTIGSICSNWTAPMPAAVLSAFTGWYTASAEQLQSVLPQLPPDSHIQLLLGSSRLQREVMSQGSKHDTPAVLAAQGGIEATPTAAQYTVTDVKADKVPAPVAEASNAAASPPAHASPAQQPQQPPASKQASKEQHLQQHGALQLLDSMAAQSLSQMRGSLDLLGSAQLCRLLMALCRFDAADQACGEDILAHLHAHLRSLPFDELVNTLSAYARWPPRRRPRMSPVWANTFLEATAAHLLFSLPASLTSAQRQQEGGTVGSDALADNATSAETSIAPSLLAELAYSLSYLALLPSPAWQHQLYLAAAGQLPAFTAPKAVHLLHAMAMWKVAAASSTKYSASNGSSGAADMTVIYPAPLVDGLVYLVAASCRSPDASEDVSTCLSEASLVIMAQVLRSLNWQPDQQVVMAMTQHISMRQQGTQAVVDKCQKRIKMLQQELQKRQDVKAAGSKRSKGSKNSKDSSQWQLDALKQNIATRQAAVAEGQSMLQQLNKAADEWQHLLQQCGTHTSSNISKGWAGARLERPAATDGSLVSSTATVRGVDGSSSGMLGGRLVRRSSHGSDLDELMIDMIVAAGMQPSPAAAAAAASAAGIQAVDVENAARIESQPSSSMADGTDETAQQEAAAHQALYAAAQEAGMRMDDIIASLRDLELAGGHSDGEHYVDTTAENVT